MQADLISVIIPVHNAETLIAKTVKMILRQTYRNLEIILVENGSNDASMNVCQELSQLFSNVHALHSDTTGTSLARKMGVEHASGKYIIFSDQDDHYINRRAIAGMHRAITEDQSHICQFGLYFEYPNHIKRRVHIKSPRIIARSANYGELIKGVAGVAGSDFDTRVWNKIYLADCLKKAVKHIDTPLFFAEDECLNLYAFFDPSVSRVSVRDEAYYVWHTSIGFSSSENSGTALCKDYSYVKPIAWRLLSQNGCSEETVFQVHLESIYLCKVIIDEMIQQNKSYHDVIDTIAELDAMEHVSAAKTYFSNQPSEKIWDELRFLISSYSPEEYYTMCCKHTPKPSFKRTILKLLRFH